MNKLAEFISEKIGYFCEWGGVDFGECDSLQYVPLPSAQLQVQRLLQAVIKRLPGARPFIVNVLKSKIGEGEKWQEVLDKFETGITNLKSEFQNLPNRLLPIFKNMEILDGNIQAATLKLQVPTRQKISHHHHLRAGMILSIFFCMLFYILYGGTIPYLSKSKCLRGRGI